ncbi:MAG: FkbM family methyltransferase [Lachnospiraceae bacterium]|nr:FkbM family methyltransferase [Lachnospiraceae bacterium]
MYFDTDIIHFEDEEVFVDGGSYDLSTTLSLSKIANLKKSYAFEADPDNVPKCNEMKERYGLKQAEIFPYGLWSSADMLTFGSTGDTNAGFYQEGKGVSIEVRALDDMINPDECVTFIKMDIEGSELEALKGSRRIIQMWRPKLAICIYHKPENMYELPMYIKELVPEYRLYLRHYSNRAHETVLYAVL